jgi:hypothetical protein
MARFQYLLLALFVTTTSSVHAAEQNSVAYDVTVSQRVNGKWKPTGEVSTYKTLSEALRAVSRINAQPDRMAKYSRREAADQNRRIGRPPRHLLWHGSLRRSDPWQLDRLVP